MKNAAVIFLVLMGLSLPGCTPDEIEVIDDTGPNVSRNHLSSKSGGVYFVVALTGDRVFRLNLKNGDDQMVGKMFHQGSYTPLEADETGWQPGQVLEGFTFRGDGLELIISLNEKGENTSKLLVAGREVRTVSYKSTTDAKVFIYDGVTRVWYETAGVITHSRYWEDLMLVQNRNYFYSGYLRGAARSRLNYIQGEFTRVAGSLYSFDLPEMIYREEVLINEHEVYWSLKEAEPNNTWFFIRKELTRIFK